MSRNPRRDVVVPGSLRVEEIDSRGVLQVTFQITDSRGAAVVNCHVEADMPSYDSLVDALLRDDAEVWAEPAGDITDDRGYELAFNDDDEDAPDEAIGYMFGKYDPRARTWEWSDAAFISDEDYERLDDQICAALAARMQRATTAAREAFRAALIG